MVELLEVWNFRDVEKFIFLFLCFWLVLLFCRLLWNDLGELVLVMERNLGCSMDMLYELYESWLWWRIGAKLSRERGVMEKRNIYEAG
jgi:hypothetical protein